MTAGHEIIGEEWNSRSRELAEWAMDHLVNRLDVWGQYSLLAPHEALEAGRSYKAMTLPTPELRGQDRVTLDKLARHFASRRQHRPQLIGLHAESKEGTSRWLAIDIDNHDLGAVDADQRARRNLLGAVEWWKAFSAMGYDPLLFDSSGKGGFHLWVLLAQPAPTADVYAMVKAIARTWEQHHLEEEPEIFPKAPKPGSLNAWFRLPGMHHTQPHYSRLWSGDAWLSDPWLEGNAAIDVMLQAIPGPPPPPAGAPDLLEARVASVAASPPSLNSPPSAASPPSLAASPPSAASPPERRAAARKRRFSPKGRPRVCLDLDGVLADRTYGRGGEELGEPIPGAVEFSRALAETADVIIHTARLVGDNGDAAGLEPAAEHIRQWLDRHGFAYLEIAVGVGKPRASAYVDDRAVSCRPQQLGPGAFDQALEAVRSLCDHP